jgi:hypothetical protein
MGRIDQAEEVGTLWAQQAEGVKEIDPGGGMKVRCEGR